MHYRAGKAEFDETYKQRSRFADDAAFISLTNQRRHLGANLLMAIRTNNRSDLNKASLLAPTPLLKFSFNTLSKLFLLDRTLPLRWRSFLWYWFILRSLAARGLLGARYK
jgi:hypothetical protein